MSKANLNSLGRILPQDRKNIIIIGTRKMSKYGKLVIDYLVPKLVSNKFTIISGLAPGCDSYSQRVALDCGGRVIGVLGYGLKWVKNDTNYQFIEKVISSEKGVIISPFKRSKKPSRETFIYRNRVMAKLGKSVLVIEAGRRSGTFDTVNYALDIGKDIFAIPGDIFRYQSIGTNNLIKEGAFLVNKIEDLID